MPSPLRSMRTVGRESSSVRMTRAASSGPSGAARGWNCTVIELDSCGAITSASSPTTTNESAAAPSAITSPRRSGLSPVFCTCTVTSGGTAGLR